MKKYTPANLILIAALFFVCYPAKAQEAQRQLPLVVTVYSNVTQLPWSKNLGIFGAPLHPGISVGTEFRYNQSSTNELFQTVKLGYHYHQYVQHSLQLFSELGYRYHFKGRFDLGSRLGLGYTHSIPDMQIFELKEGDYQKKSNWGRPQFMTSLALEAGFEVFNKKVNPVRLFITYQFYLQMPFVNEYVPLLPNTALHLGVAFPFLKYKKETQ